MGSGREYETLPIRDGKLPKLTGRKVFGSDSQRFGRMDEFSKLGLTAIAFALKDAKLDTWKGKRPVGIIASTVHGCLSTDIAYLKTVTSDGGAFASPNTFTYTLPNIFLGEASIRFGLTGMGFVINEASLSGLTGLKMVLCSIMRGEHETMLTGLCDLGCPPSLTPAGRSYPGAIFFVFETTVRESIAPYGGLGLHEGGEVVFNGTRVDDLYALFSCAMNMHPGAFR